jgi:hypothetical protein
MAERPARRDQPTRYPGVYLRDGVLYYRFWNERGKKQRVRFGVGSPKAVWSPTRRAKEEKVM